MTELNLSQQLIEKRALRCLKTLKQPIDSEIPAIVQLMAWRMDQEPRVFCKMERQADVREVLEGLTRTGLPKVDVLRFAMETEEGEPLLTPDDLKGLRPEDAAETLLEVLEIRMREEDM